MAKQPDNDFELISEYISYDPITGALTWKRSPSRGVPEGAPAGGINQGGYLCLTFRRRVLLGHRVAFLLFHKRWPKGEIDHINGDPLDNRIENLREASRVMNGQNIRRPMSHNSSGFLGVTRHKASGKWQAEIQCKGKHIYLGMFTNPEDAHEAYLAAKRTLHIGCTL